MSSDFGTNNTKNIKRIIWITITGLLIVWVFLMGGLSGIGNLFGTRGCDTTWEDEYGFHSCVTASVSGKPRQIIAGNEGDHVKLLCSGSASIATQYGREKAENCQGVTDRYGSLMTPASNTNNAQAWPFPQVPILGLICTTIGSDEALGSSHNWFRAHEWSYPWAGNGFNSYDNGGVITFDKNGLLYCGANAPLDNSLLNPRGSYRLEATN